MSDWENEEKKLTNPHQDNLEVVARPESSEREKPREKEKEKLKEEPNRVYAMR